MPYSTRDKRAKIGLELGKDYKAADETIDKQGFRKLAPKTENPRVGGSSPPPGINQIKPKYLIFLDF
ncbi:MULTISPECIES: hypothetical protein [Cyanophyceae]|uniref:hypothetical protein n=1 Tax=Cyanophyceae TaxID=3028117 RepID=UPI001687B953|nr:MULTISPECIES: hypothetical protein [Cyanophyceae]MBD1917451.1 hypothetical protein [Phormidium sp. FACHB-77]MBD2032304.1 hypothetical protein [Phormidium sp. FACHB-322]MBD2052242.1 hypothetical protein [Leptolyngbya sp. FACHB-60]